MSNLTPCKECGQDVAVSAKTCPNCGVSQPGQAPLTPQQNIQGWLIIGVVVLGALYFFWPESESDEEIAIREQREAEEQAENKKAGFHCLSNWDGSHRDVVQQVENNLRDPDSFEHMETRITPVDDSGQHSLSMEYRANNAFGGKVVGQALATVSNATCNATLLRVE
ncbi:hypothetical protein [Saccharospirillum impatiens]|uniref:hypothetical protein n=1 Tax=Saccharospirillum impatiens TaxID=169438 RepID=UPI0004904458|nr:hypothetical protein [Saccharospirillum impatiens]